MIGLSNRHMRVKNWSHVRGLSVIGLEPMLFKSHACSPSRSSRVLTRAVLGPSPSCSQFSAEELSMPSKEVQTITCRGAVCWGPGEPLTVEDIQVEPPRKSEIRVRMLYASICHTDVKRWRGIPFALFPRILGHEGVGMVESVGEDVEEIKEGDLVIPTFIGECKECPNCNSGKTNICLKHPLILNGLMPDETSRMSVRGQRLYHLFTCSTFCQFMVVNVNYVVKIDPKISLPHASLLSCGFSTGLGLAWKEAKIENGSSVAVFGLGGVGIGAVVGARLSGASKIIGVDLNEYKKDKAKIFGMTDFINPRDLNGKSLPDLIREMTGGLGVDYCLECTGKEALPNEAIEATVVGRGVTTLVSGAIDKVPINLSAILPGRILKGSIFGGIKPRSDLPAIFAKCINKEICLDEVLTHKVDLDNINRALELIKEPDCFKVLIQIDQS